VSEKLFSLENNFSWKIIFHENDFHPYQTHPKFQTGLVKGRFFLATPSQKNDYSAPLGWPSWVSPLTATNFGGNHIFDSFVYLSP